ncbi:MAG: ABC transporter ATP-binding protein [Deltaproteobacteria bacterium]|nr:ABC transporter ATP-binding protein [Deltaproteobacteria bacterium]
MTTGTRVERIAVRDVTKLFGAHRALRRVSMAASAGETIGIIGKNGAGKSTLLSILSTMMRPTLGTLEINGRPATAMLRSAIGLLSHKSLVYPALTCQENLEMFARLCGAPQERVTQLMERLALQNFFTDRPAGVLSRGQIQRLSLARALIGAPEVLLLDEPTSGLDRSATALFESLVKAHRESGKIAFVVSHDPQLIADLCTRIVLLELGEIQLETSARSAAQVSELLEGDVK